MTTRRHFLHGSAAALAWPAPRLLANPTEATVMHNNNDDRHDDSRNGAGRHDFDFFPGRWDVQNRRHVGANQWNEFPATLDFRPLGGLGNIDEYRNADVPD